MCETKLEKRHTEKAKRLYEFLFDEKWPDGWSIVWNVDGLTLGKEKMIYMFADLCDQKVLIHELNHVHRYLKEGYHEHSKEFVSQVRKLINKAKRFK